MSTIKKDDVKAMVLRDPLAVYRAAGLHLKKAGGGLHKCPCPFHKEKTASFTVYEKDGGFKCFGGSCGMAGDAIKFIQQKEGLSFAEALTRINSIYGGVERPNRPPPTLPPSSPTAPQARLEAFPIPAAAALEAPVPAKYKGFLYHDRNGNPVLWKFRKDRSPQWFDGKRLQKKGFPCRPLFNLPALLKNNGAKPIIIAEGEPATAALIEAGFLATTSVGGSSAFSQADWNDLPTDCPVYLWPDDDDAGAKMVEGVAEILQGRGIKDIFIISTDGMKEFKKDGQGDAADINPVDRRASECQRRMDGALRWNPPKPAVTQAPTPQEAKSGGDSGRGRRSKKDRDGGDRPKLMKELHTALREMGEAGDLGWDWGEDKIHALGLYEGDMNFVGRIAAHLSNVYDIHVSVTSIEREARAIAQGYEINTFKDYMERIHLKWMNDNPPRILDKIASRYIPGLTNPDICDHFLSKWYIAGIVKRCVTDHEVSMPYMPAIVAPEGAGKNRLIVNLWGAKKKTTISFSQDNRELIIAMRGKCVAEVAEMRGFRKSEDEKIKAFITPDASGDTYRPLYSGAAVQSLRRSVLIGTSNESNFLSSITGNRRFVIMITDCAPDAIQYTLAEKERETLMAEAYDRFLELGDKACQTDKQYWEQVSQMNNKFIVYTPLTDLILKWLLNNAGGDKQIRPGDILEYLDKNHHTPRSDLTLKHIRQSLVSLGFRKTKTRAEGDSVEIWKETPRWEEVRQIHLSDNPDAAKRGGWDD